MFTASFDGENFNPADLTITAGDNITWYNSSSNTSFQIFGSETISPGNSFSQNFPSEGSFSYSGGIVTVLPEPTFAPPPDIDIGTPEEIQLINVPTLKLLYLQKDPIDSLIDSSSSSRSTPIAPQIKDATVAKITLPIVLVLFTLGAYYLLFKHTHVHKKKRHKRRHK